MLIVLLSPFGQVASADIGDQVITPFITVLSRLMILVSLLRQVTSLEIYVEFVDVIAQVIPPLTMVELMLIIWVPTLGQVTSVKTDSHVIPPFLTVLSLLIILISPLEHVASLVCVSPFITVEKYCVKDGLADYQYLSNIIHI